MAPPSISVIVPAHDAAPLLAVTLPAIRAGYVIGIEWELVVVDDGSGDATAETAAGLADRVIRLDPPARGPAAARNAGAAVARGDWLLFVDADVRLRPDALDRLIGSIAEHPEAVAIFGSYDAAPEGRGVVSQFRNLLHHRVHQRGAGPAETFWAGLGAMRRDPFLAAGGFDAARFPKPRIEDIELGYRVRDRGGAILLDPRIQGTHLKSWSLLSMVRTDFLDRGIPWTRVLLERRGTSRGTLAADRRESLRTLLAALASAALVWALLRGQSGTWWVFVGLAALYLASCLPVYAWFARERGWRFGLVSIPLLAVYHLVAFASGVAGLTIFLVRPKPRAG